MAGIVGAVTIPANALEPIVMLSIGIHSQPGVYALLLGSGVSTGAGIPTAWGVVEDLIRRVAAAKNPDSEGAAEVAAKEPEAWWLENGDGQPLTYSNLLAAVAAAPAARQALVAGFFEPTQEDLETGRKVPSPAHRAIAELVKRGLIKVIITTNFDPLIERALQDAGAPPQVISRPEMVNAMTPLEHAAATVIKPHGDYSNLDMRNTGPELAEYPAEWNSLVDEIFDRYGLLICGWSGDSDAALVSALARTKSRRYPMYWDSRSSKKEPATRLLAQHSGTVVQAASADELFTGLVSRIGALERLAEPPVTTAIAVARLKRYVADPVRRVDVHDLVIGATDEAFNRIAAQPVYHPECGPAVVDEALAQMAAAVTPVLYLLVSGVRHDREGAHVDLWVECLQRLMQARRPFEGGFNEYLDKARHYPALMALRLAGVASMLAGRDEVLLRLLTEPSWRDRYANNARIPAGQALHEGRVFGYGGLVALPRWNGQRPYYPVSRMLREDLREPLRDLLPDDEEYDWQHDQYEYRAALYQFRTPAIAEHYGPEAGLFIGEWRWDQGTGAPTAELEFRAAAASAPDTWPWWPIVGGPGNLEQALLDLRAELQSMKR